jgi:hypothetical protein
MQKLSPSFKKIIVIISTLAIILILILSYSAILYFKHLEEKHPWDISYTAEYEEPFNLSSIIRVFQMENIYYEEVYSNSLFISFGKGINNSTIEPTTGGLTNGFEYYHVTISLNESIYPPNKDKEIVDSRRSLLEDSMNYITIVVYKATGSLPISKEFYIRMLYA